MFGSCHLRPTTEQLQYRSNIHEFTSLLFQICHYVYSDKSCAAVFGTFGRCHFTHESSDVSLSSKPLIPTYILIRCPTCVTLSIAKAEKSPFHAITVLISDPSWLHDWRQVFWTNKVVGAVADCRGSQNKFNMLNFILKNRRPGPLTAAHVNCTATATDTIWMKPTALLETGRRQSWVLNELAHKSACNCASSSLNKGRSAPCGDLAPLHGQATWVLRV